MFDDDGTVYVTAQMGADKDSHIIQYEIDIATGAALSEPVVVARGDEEYGRKGRISIKSKAAII